jgi:DNA-binding response OmpR family regulator
MRLLVVEDDVKVAGLISNGFEQADFEVDVVHDGEAGLEHALTGVYDAIILDIMLPGRDGLSVLKIVREKGINTPVIILSANFSLEDRLKGLNTGSDDYLVKPFSFAELLARVQALLRRSKPVPDVEYSIADLIMDLIGQSVVRAGKNLDLLPREFKLLQFLLYNKTKVVSKSMILEHVWGYSFDPQTNVVDVLVCRLRNKVDKGFDVKLIHTIRGIGYVIKEE